MVFSKGTDGILHLGGSMERTGSRLTGAWEKRRTWGCVGQMKAPR